MRLTKIKIEKAIRLYDAYKTLFGESDPNDSGSLLNRSTDVSPILKRFRDLQKSPERTRLKNFLESLKKDELHELEAIIFYGRHHYGRNRFEEAFNDARMRNPVDVEIQYLLQKVESGDFLREGFEKLNAERLI